MKPGRKPTEDRSTVRSAQVVIKLTPPEAATLDRLIDRRWRELTTAAGGARIVLTRSAVIRALIQEEARRVLPDAPPAPPRHAPPTEEGQP